MELADVAERFVDARIMQLCRTERAGSRIDPNPLESTFAP